MIPSLQSTKPMQASANLVHASQLDMSRDELAMLSAFREMDDEGRVNILRMSKVTAERWPRHAPPKLRMVKGGAK
jgi:hypothetical protein